MQQNGNEMLDFLNADGFVAALDGDIFSIGSVPSDENLASIDSWFYTSESDNIFMTVTLLEISSTAQKICDEGICGLTAIKISVSGGMVVRFYWFREGEIKEIKWAGNLNKTIAENEEAEMLSPRRSFEKYIETKRGHAKAWSNEEKIKVARFRNTILGWL